MKKFLLLIVLGEMLFSLTAGAQYTRYIVRLKDKSNSSFSLNSPSAYLSAKAIARRTKYKISIDSTDLPITRAYLDSIKAVPNITVLNVSKWLNQVCIRITDPAALAKINSFPFVKSSAPVAVRIIQHSPATPSRFEIIDPLPVLLKPTGTARTFDIMGIQDFYNYGNNSGQIHIHEGEYLHNLGFHGEGITIAMLDAGFNNYKGNPAFDSIRAQNQVLGEMDYVTNDQSVNEDHYHGALCLSTIAANEPGVMVGTAPKAKFWLLRTEDAATEYPVEEANWAAAAEFADSVGADMISSSLGYADFDDASFSHSYAQRDGKTAMISIAANLAVKKGMLVTISAGNSGTNAGDAKYVGCPGDADSVLTIGATDVNGNMASFSSWGPNGAGHLKPNVVSVGQGAVVAHYATGLPIFANGTSLSNPNLCGLVACLWQAFPEFNNMEIMNALQRSADRHANPDNRFGYGTPKMSAAYQDLLMQRNTKNYQQMLGGDWLKAYPVPVTDNFTVLLKAPGTGHGSLRLMDMNGKTIEVKNIETQQGTIYTIGFTRMKSISHGIYSIQYIEGRNKAAVRIVK
jgi:serine protease AprX